MSSISEQAQHLRLARHQVPQQATQPDRLRTQAPMDQLGARGGESAHRHLLELGRPHRGATKAIKRPVAGGGHQPRPRIARHSVAFPALQGSGEGSYKGVSENSVKRRVAATVELELRARTSAADRMQEIAAKLYGLNRTDLQALEVISRTGGISPSELAHAVGLTTGGMTTVIDGSNAPVTHIAPPTVGTVESWWSGQPLRRATGNKRSSARS